MSALRLKQNYCKGKGKRKSGKTSQNRAYQRAVWRDTVGLFEEMGLDCSALREKGRKLILPVGNGEIEDGTGKGRGCDHLCRAWRLRFWSGGKGYYFRKRHRFLRDFRPGLRQMQIRLSRTEKQGFFGGYSAKTIATKYPNVRNYVEEKGMDVRIIKIEGSVELAPLLGLSDAIVDIVETGSTLKENGLEVIDDVAPISARLIVNTACMKLQNGDRTDFSEMGSSEFG